MSDAAERRVRWVVRESRRLIRLHDPAHFRAWWKWRAHAKPPREYDTPALVVAGGMMAGAETDEAVELLRREIADMYGRKLVWNSERKLVEDFRTMIGRLAAQDAEGW